MVFANDERQEWWKQLDFEKDKSMSVASMGQIKMKFNGRDYVGAGTLMCRANEKGQRIWIVVTCGQTFLQRKMMNQGFEEAQDIVFRLQNAGEQCLMELEIERVYVPK